MKVIIEERLQLKKDEKEKSEKKQEKKNEGYID